MTGPSLFAISDLHVSYPENRDLVRGLRPEESDGAWLIVASDAGDMFADVRDMLATLRERFAQVFGRPANTSCGQTRVTRCRLVAKTATGGSSECAATSVCSPRR